MCVSARKKEKEKRLELSSTNLADSAWLSPSMRRPESEGQGHAVVKCAAGVGVQVDITALVSLVVSEGKIKTSKMRFSSR